MSIVYSLIIMAILIYLLTFLTNTDEEWKARLKPSVYLGIASVAYGMALAVFGGRISHMIFEASTRGNYVIWANMLEFPKYALVILALWNVAVVLRSSLSTKNDRQGSL